MADTLFLILSVLTVVTADPDDLESLRELQLASGAREVRAVLARPAAVKALIAKVYGGDGRAFASFERFVPRKFLAVARGLSASESRAGMIRTRLPPATNRAFLAGLATAFLSRAK